jgi:hypothetical protein
MAAGNGQSLTIFASPGLNALSLTNAVQAGAANQSHLTPVKNERSSGKSPGHEFILLLFLFQFSLFLWIKFGLFLFFFTAFIFFSRVTHSWFSFFVCNSLLNFLFSMVSTDNREFVALFVDVFYHHNSSLKVLSSTDGSSVRKRNSSP